MNNSINPHTNICQYISKTCHVSCFIGREEEPTGEIHHSFNASFNVSWLLYVKSPTPQSTISLCVCFDLLYLHEFWVNLTTETSVQSVFIPHKHQSVLSVQTSAVPHLHTDCMCACVSVTADTLISKPTEKSVFF